MIKSLFKKLISLKSKKNSGNVRINFDNIFKWLDSNSREGIWISNVQNKPYPEVTGYFIPTLLQWGEKNRAAKLSQWLVKQQKMMAPS